VTDLPLKDAVHATKEKVSGADDHAKQHLLEYRLFFNSEYKLVMLAHRGLRKKGLLFQQVLHAAQLYLKPFPLHF
jgi:hypothetical protein